MTSVLLIDNYDSFTYNLAQLLAESELCTYTIVKNDRVKIRQIFEFDKLLLSPGPGTPQNAGQLMAVLQAAYKEIPILGVCLGMQAMAEYFGGHLYNLPQVYHGRKTKIKIQDEQEYIFNGLKNREVGLYHSWAVQSLPDCLQLTAESEEGILMGLRHKEYDLRGVQFHPESHMTPEGEKMINNWLKH